MSPYTERSLRSALRQARGSLRSLNNALQSPTCPRRTLLEAARASLLLVEETLRGEVGRAGVERQTRAREAA